MTLERKILILAWVVGLVITLLVVRPANVRLFVLAVITSQTITWISVILLVKYHRIQFPVREFPKATDIGFSLDYELYPIIVAVYMIAEWRRSRLASHLYLLLWSAALATIHSWISAYTQLIDDVHFNWFYAFLCFIGVLGFTRIIIRWFYRNDEVLQAELSEVQP